jgi:hypothetical protein
LGDRRAGTGLERPVIWPALCVNLSAAVRWLTLDAAWKSFGSGGPRGYPTVCPVPGVYNGEARQAEDAMNRTDTNSKPETLLIGAKQDDLRRRRRRTWAAGLVAAAAAVALVAWVLGPGLDREESIEPSQGPTPAEEVAYGFLAAYATADNPRAASYLAEDAVLTDLGEPRWLVWRTAAGYRMLNESCEQQATTPDGTQVVCAFDYHMLGSEERGLGPFSGDHITFIVQDDKIAAATEVSTFLWNGFSDQMWEPFARWMAANYAEDAAVMYSDDFGSARKTDRSLALWEQHVQDYANQNQ